MIVLREPVVGLKEKQISIVPVKIVICYKINQMAILIYMLQVLFAKVWLKYFSFGPLEWTWRCLTYGKLFPLRKQK